MPEIKYKHAFVDGDRDKIVSIDEITEENRNQYKFRCIGCGQEILPRAIGSKYRKPHFWHGVRDGVECSGETYLHKLTKHIIRKKFEENPTFKVEYHVTKECDNAECKYRTPRCREEFSTNKVDLKEYYDTCTEEAPIKGYIADILLSNSKNANIEPTLIEVCVSHPCDEEKRNSGLHIIEIRIKDEQNAIDLQKDEVICEFPRYTFKREKKAEFISFKREIKKRRKTKIQRYVYIPTQNSIGYLTKIDCDKAKQKLRTESVVELNMVANYCKIKDALLWMAQNKGLRSCFLCKFYYQTQYEDFPICRLSKKYGTPARPAMDEAKRCRSYSMKNALGTQPEDILIEEVLPSPFSVKPEYMKPKYKVVLSVSKSFRNYKLFKEKVKYFLSEKMKTHTLVVITGASKLTDVLTDKLSKEIDFIKEPHEAHWDRYGQDAISVSNDEMTSCADAVIVFWDGQSFGISNLLEFAKQKNIKTAIVRY